MRHSILNFRYSSALLSTRIAPQHRSRNTRCSPRTAISGSISSNTKLHRHLDDVLVTSATTYKANSASGVVWSDTCDEVSCWFPMRLFVLTKTTADHKLTSCWKAYRQVEQVRTKIESDKRALIIHSKPEFLLHIQQYRYHCPTPLQNLYITV